MKRENYSKVAVIVLFILLPSLVHAQNFKWKSSITGIKSDGFHKIQLLPEIVSRLTNDLGDLRIIDGSGRETPYITEQEIPYIEKDYFTEYKIIEKKEQAFWPYYTRIVIHNPRKSEIANINLIIRNSDVTKRLKLSGSDDKTKWYVIKDNYLFHAMYSDNETSVIKIIDFPLSNYEYYEILIDDWKSNPISILKAGYFNTAIEKGKYSENEKPQISKFENSDLKETLIKLKFTFPQLINKLSLKVIGPEFYYRNATIQIKDSMPGARNKYEPYFKTIDNIIICSSSSNTFYFDNVKTNELYIRIINHNDQSLDISDISAFQLNHYLIGKFKSSDSYSLEFGNQDIHAPVYDLKYFSKEIPVNIPVISSGPVVSFGKEKPTNQTGFQLNKKFIWVFIGLVLILLIYMVSKMLGEMQKHKKE